MVIINRLEKVYGGVFDDQVMNMGKIYDGTFNDRVDNNGNIEGGVYHSVVKNNGTISDENDVAQFYGRFTNTKLVENGSFYNRIDNYGNLNIAFLGDGAKIFTHGKNSKIGYIIIKGEVSVSNEVLEHMMNQDWTGVAEVRYDGLLHMGDAKYFDIVRSWGKVELNGSIYDTDGNKLLDGEILSVVETFLRLRF